MPVIKVLLRTGATQTDVDAIRQLANAATPSGVIPSATVTFNGPTGPGAVEVGMPDGIAANDLTTAIDAINTHSKVAFSGTFPARVLDENFNTLDLGPSPAAYQINGFDMVLGAPAEFDIVPNNLELVGGQDGVGFVGGAGKQHVLVDLNLGSQVMNFTVPQGAIRLINTIGAFSGQFLINNGDVVIFAGNLNFAVRETVAGGPMTHRLTLFDNFSLNQIQADYTPGGIGNGGLVKFGLDAMGVMTISMEDGNGALQSISLPVGFVPSVLTVGWQINNGLNPGVDVALDDILMNIDGGT